MSPERLEDIRRIAWLATHDASDAAASAQAARRSLARFREDNASVRADLRRLADRAGIDLGGGPSIAARPVFFS
jgi:hypothetical protein